MTRSDARASLTYSREAVVDNDADLLAAAVGEGGVDGDPAHEQADDLPSLGVREVLGKASADLRQHIVGDGVVKIAILGFEIVQSVIQHPELLFDLGGDGVELVVGELGAGVEVDGALAAKLCGIAGVDERGALGFRDGAGLDVIGLREELIDEVRGIGKEAGYIRPDRVPPTSRP